MTSRLSREAFRRCLSAQVHDPAAAAFESRLGQDLGIDSLAMHALLIDIEEAGGIIPSPDVLKSVCTVADLYAAVSGASVS